MFMFQYKLFDFFLVLYSWGLLQEADEAKGDKRQENKYRKCKELCHVWLHD